MYISPKFGEIKSQNPLAITNFPFDQKSNFVYCYKSKYEPTHKLILQDIGSENTIDFAYMRMTVKNAS